MVALILRGWSCKDRHTDGSVAFHGAITYFEGMEHQRGEPIYAQRTRWGPSDALQPYPSPTCRTRNKSSFAAPVTLVEDEI